MDIRCVWEHNGGDTILYADNFIGAYTRGANLEEARAKMAGEVRSWLRWAKKSCPGDLIASVVQESTTDVTISDADSVVLFDAERSPLSIEEYLSLKALALKSAGDFLALYEAIPDKNASSLPVRRTFYGFIPRTAEEMYCHTRSVNDYYFTEINVPADNEGTILDCRRRGFDALETIPGFLENRVILGSYDEEWSLRKVLRRFIWHDRIHAKAMYRMALKTFGAGCVPDIFGFEAE